MVHVLADEIVEVLKPAQSIKDTLFDNRRKDGRSLTKFRKPTISTDVFPAFDGSASVGIDGTCVMVGVTGLVHTTPQNSLVVNLTKSVFAREQEINSEVVQLVASLQRALNGALNFSALQISQDLFWGLQLDVQIIESDGSLLSVALIACLAALLSTKLPREATMGRDLKVRVGEEKAFLPVICLPAVAVFAGFTKEEDEKVQGDILSRTHWVYDPSSEEGAAAALDVALFSQSPLPSDGPAPFERTWTISHFADRRAKDLTRMFLLARAAGKDVPQESVTPAMIESLIAAGSDIWVAAEKQAESVVSALKKSCKSHFKAGEKGRLTFRQ